MYRMEVRLNKLISDSGLCSRREADKFIEEGRVTVNGSLPHIGQKVTEADIVMLDDIQIKIGKNTGKQTSSARINIQELELAGQESKPIVKRVIATAGQTVDIDFNLGQVYVDGELLDEDYINDYTYREEGTVFPLTVPEGEVFLMGDNRNHSNDSRDSSLGTVDTRLLIGKAVFLVFPGRDYLTEQREFGRIGLLQ